MIQAGLFLFIISASFILQIHYMEKGIFHSVNLNKKQFKQAVPKVVPKAMQRVIQRAMQETA